MLVVHEPVRQLLLATIECSISLVISPRPKMDDAALGYHVASDAEPLN